MKDIFLGLAIFGDGISLKDPFVSAQVLTGHYDEILLKTFFWMEKKEEPTEGAHLRDERCLMMLERTKAEIRATISAIFKMAEDEERMAAEAKRNQVLAELREHNKPHELGTVAEIATKLGISKSEVRRRKAAGEL